MLKNTLLPFIFFPFFSFCQKIESGPVIPVPVSFERHSGRFTLPETCIISCPEGHPDWLMAAEYLAATLRQATGYSVSVRTDGDPNATILLKADAGKVSPPEGYVLAVDSKQIRITAAHPAGAFYGIQTLRQLFPPAIYAAAPQKDVSWEVTACTISDAPRFGWRGLHLDVGRHWFPVSFIKRYIDLLALHKMNRFHWHLTDDQGWRIEIKKYPRLQSIGACRNQTLIGHYGDAPARYDNAEYCHYYTQEEVKEVVEYARQRFVTVVPEIEMPGHAMAALTAYPELGCTGGPYEVQGTWGVHKEVFCAGNDAVLSFINDVFDEICPLFPGEYVHVGGDECPKDRWQSCEKCQAKIRMEGLKDEHELQSWLITEAGKMLTRHGKKMIGWDEILEGGLPKGATVMSWRGTEGGIAAARSGHDAVMTPGSHCYFDYYQSDPANEPLAIGGMLRIEKVYGYEPVPEELSESEAAHIIGVQGNVWTEYISEASKVEYMVFPRACALAEVAWSPKSRRQWDDFRQRLPRHFERLEALGVGYARSIFDVKSAFNAGKMALSCDYPGVTIRYTTDGSIPVLTSPVYDKPFDLTVSATVAASAWRDTVLLGKATGTEYFVHKASGKPYTLSKAPGKYDGGAPYALTDGVTGHIKSHDHWIGLVNHVIDPVIDLGAATAFDKVTTHYVNNKDSWIHPPRSVEVLVSNDGKKFRSLGKKNINLAINSSNRVETVTFSVPRTKARYIKLVAESTGVIPEGYPGAGQGAWLFIDEIIIE